MENNDENAEPKMLIFSDTLGCPEKTKKRNFYLSNVACRPLFFNSLKKFLDNNERNKAAFVGNFFDKGRYAMTNIIQIMKLKSEKSTADRVHIVLSYREIHKLRFRFELDKVLLKKGVYEYPEKEDLLIKKTYIPIDVVVDNNFDNRRTKRYVNAIYQRIVDLLIQTHDGRMSDCILIHESLFRAFKNARRQGYLELIILLQQLGAFILVYPFLQDFRWRTFLGKDEIKLMIQFIVKNIKEYYDTYCKFDEAGAVRTDPINKDLKKHLSNIYSVVDAKADDFDPYQVEKVPPIEIWDDMCNGFFSQGKLVIHDNDYNTLLCHDYALIDFFKTLRISFALIVKDDAIEQIYRKTEGKDNIEWTHALYYYKLNYFYEIYDYLHELLMEEDIDKEELLKKVEKKKLEYFKLLCKRKEIKETTRYVDYTDTITGKDDEKMHDIERNKEKCVEILAIDEEPKKVNTAIQTNNEGGNIVTGKNKTKKEKQNANVEAPTPANTKTNEAVKPEEQKANEEAPAPTNAKNNVSVKPEEQKANVEAPTPNNTKTNEAVNPEVQKANVEAQANAEPKSTEVPENLEEEVQANPETQPTAEVLANVEGPVNAETQAAAEVTGTEDTPEATSNEANPEVQANIKDKNQKGGTNVVGGLGSQMEFFLSKSIREIDINQYAEVKAIGKFDNYIEFLNSSLLSMVSADLTVMNREQMDLFLFFHTFYLWIFNHPQTFFNDDNLKRDNGILEFLHNYGLQCFVFGTVETGNSFPLTLEHELGEDDSGKSIVMVAPNISNFIFERFFTPGSIINEKDDEELDKYMFMMLRNYPILSIDISSGEPVTKITSLTKKGILDSSETYIGEFMAHTFIDYYLSHDYINYDFASDGQLPINQEIATLKLKNKMIPEFDTTFEPYTADSIFLGNMLFIHLETDITAEGRKTMFLVLYLDFKKDKDSESKVYYYLGDIGTWDGNFWDMKNNKILTYTMTPEDGESLNKYLLGLKLIDIFPPLKAKTIDIGYGISMDDLPDEDNEEENKEPKPEKENDEQQEEKSKKGKGIGKGRSKGKDKKKGTDKDKDKDKKKKKPGSKKGAKKKGGGIKTRRNRKN